jgi:hypothetical protein
MTHVNPDRWKQTYKVQIKGSRAIEIMKILRPHMGLRRGERIDSIVSAYSPRRYRKLTTDEALAIKRRKGLARARDIAAEYGLHIKTVEMIWSGRRWNQLEV